MVDKREVGGFVIDKQDRPGQQLRVDLIDSPMTRAMKRLGLHPLVVSLARDEKNYWDTNPEKRFIFSGSYPPYAGVNPIIKEIAKLEEEDLRKFMLEVLTWYSDLLLDLGHIAIDLRNSIRENGYTEGNTTLLHFIDDFSGSVTKIEMDKEDE